MNYQEQVSSKELDLEERKCLGEAQKGLLRVGTEARWTQGGGGRALGPGPGAAAGPGPSPGT